MSWSKPKGWLWDAIELILNQSFYDFLIFHAFGKKVQVELCLMYSDRLLKGQNIFQQRFFGNMVYICLYNLSELRFMFEKGWRTDSDLVFCRYIIYIQIRMIIYNIIYVNICFYRIRQVFANQHCIFLFFAGY